MSLRGCELKALVAQRLVVAAEEIFALFERTFAEYQDEVLRSNLLQQPGVVLYKEGTQTFPVSVDSGSEPAKVIKEEDPAVEPLPSVTVKSEENIDEDPAEENRQEPIEEQCEGEEPGHSVDLHLDNNKQHQSSSDTDNSSDWESMNKRATKYNRHKLKAGHSKNSATDNVMGNDRPHQCAQCSRSFKSEKLLEIHVQHHTWQGSFTCQICSKVYCHERAYRKHLRGHNEQVSFSCSICPRRFKHRGHLNQHIMSHTGEKPFTCPSCGLKYGRRSTLKMHVRTMHSEERLHTCSVCQRDFVQKDELVSHMQIHTEKRPYSCSFCDKGYWDRASLKYHIVQHHKVNAEKMGGKS